MWCLGRILPLLIGNFIPDDDPFWNNYLSLLTIIDFLFAPALTTSKADFLVMEIEDFLVDFRELYPNRPLIPKMHYMIHMPSWIKRYTCNCMAMCIFLLVITISVHGLV